MTEQPTPMAAIPLDYAGRPADPRLAVVRFVATAAVAHGAAVGLSSGWTLLNPWAGAYYNIRFLNNLPVAAIFLTESARVGVAMSVVVGGVLLLQRRPIGLTWVTAAEVAYVVLAVLMVPLVAWQYYGRFSGRGTGQLWVQVTANHVVNVPVGLVLPILIWAVCRRPEVRAGMGR